jgi:protein-S-isoprenylcysteine O-methyltransferase Ste14
VIVLARHLFAIAVLPFVMAVVIPFWLFRGGGTQASIGTAPIAIAAQIGGAALLILGLILFAASLRRFAGDGKGTLAPWDPPRRLVVRGPYRYVRNPMISGVIFVLFGEALLLLSRTHARWALAFLAINAVHIPLLEEPKLRQRFGAAYDDYCTHVPRLIPLRRPWTRAGDRDSA